VETERAITVYYPPTDVTVPPRSLPRTDMG